MAIGSAATAPPPTQSTNNAAITQPTGSSFGKKVESAIVNGCTTFGAGLGAYVGYSLGQNNASESPSQTTPSTTTWYSETFGSNDLTPTEAPNSSNIGSTLKDGSMIGLGAAAGAAAGYLTGHLIVAGGKYFGRQVKKVPACVAQLASECRKTTGSSNPDVETGLKAVKKALMKAETTEKSLVKATTEAEEAQTKLTKVAEKAAEVQTELKEVMAQLKTAQESAQAQQEPNERTRLIYPNNQPE